MNNRPHALYRFFDKDDRLLYVGISLDPGARWKTHAREKEWWSDVARVSIEEHPTRKSVLDAESAAIRSECPLRNIAGNPSPVERQRQSPRLEPIDPEADELLASIRTHVDRRRQALERRDQAIARARSNGQTWRAIAAAADMTELGCRKIVERVEGRG